MALVDNRYKILSDMEGPNDADLLFDLRDDPGETTNLAAKHPEILRSMKAKLTEFRESCQWCLRGKDYAEPFTPDKDDIHPARRGAAAGKAAVGKGDERRCGARGGLHRQDNSSVPGAGVPLRTPKLTAGNAQCAVQKDDSVDVF